MQSGKASISHVVVYCFDFRKMLDFYTNVLGFHLYDIGRARGNDICFLTFDPETDHHQLALAGGRTGPKEGGALNHVAFRVGSLADLRRRYEGLKRAEVQSIETITHGSWLSVYYRDPEGNRLEFFWDTPWYVRQPVVEPLDLSLPDDEILRATEAACRNAADFRPMAEWKAEAAKTPAA
jgi:catechol 2,3-dioxygenase-like lactoylglutathione lyase family enzyme